MANRRNTGRAMTLPSGLALGAAVSGIVTICVSFIGAQLIMNEVIGQEQIGYCSLITLLMGSILGAITSAGKIKRKKFMVCLISGGIYFLILLGTTALFFGGQYEGIGVTFLTVLIGSLVAVLIQNRKVEGRPRYRRKKI